MKKRIVLLAIIILFSVVAVSCSKENDDIIKYYKTAKDAADACGRVGAGEVLACGV